MAKQDLKVNHDIDIFEDVLLRGSEYLLMYADVSIFDEIVLKVISGDIGILGISETESMIPFSSLIANIDYNNKYAEVSGKEQYHLYLMNELKKLPREIDLTIPIQISGKRIWLRLTAHPVKKSENICVFGVSNVTELLNSEELIYEKTHKDALTGLFNIYSFDYHYGMRYLKPDLHILYLDLDNFKKVNDTYGHAIGDIVLKDFSNILLSYQNEENCFYRVGGDEFIGMIFAKEDRAKEIAEGILEKTRSIKVEPIVGKITVSIGMIKSVKGDDLARKADSILYKVKTSGKNNYLYETEEMS